MKYILTLSCPDRPGIVHAVTGLLLERRANIIEAGQFSDLGTGLFFMRVRFDEPTDTAAASTEAVSTEAVSTEAASTEGASIEEQFAPIAGRFAMDANFARDDARMRTVIMVSQAGHCLNDLLFRWRSGLLPLDIRAIVSNHRDFYQLAASYDIPFHHLPVTPTTKSAAESRLLEIVDSEQVELVVLARYMQVLSDDLCRRLAGQAINIHHSFLPSFKGARPYQQALDRGVKLIGATAHYVTAELDEGPIIEQDVARADHTMDVASLSALGRDVESQVLARAVKWHAEHRILRNGHKTVIFR